MMDIQKTLVTFVEDGNNNFCYSYDIAYDYNKHPNVVDDIIIQSENCDYKYDKLLRKLVKNETILEFHKAKTETHIVMIY